MMLEQLGGDLFPCSCELAVCSGPSTYLGAKGAQNIAEGLVVHIILARLLHPVKFIPYKVTVFSIIFLTSCGTGSQDLNITLGCGR